MTFKQSRLRFPIPGGCFFFSWPLFPLFLPHFCFCIPDCQAGLLAQRNDPSSLNKMSHTLNLGDVGGPAALGGAPFNPSLLFSMPLGKRVSIPAGPRHQLMFSCCQP